jgi:hypothetical protein
MNATSSHRHGLAEFTSAKEAQLQSNGVSLVLLGSSKEGQISLRVEFRSFSV